MKRLFMTLAAAFAAMALMADTWTDPDTGYTWTYTISGDEAKIANGNSPAIDPLPSGVVMVPNTLGGKLVTAIGQSAFRGCNELTFIRIPNTVANIGMYAFKDCSELERIHIPASVTSIHRYAFDNCGGLTRIQVAAGNANYKSVNGMLLTKDGTTLVQGINGDVTIPDGVTTIGDSAFSGCSGLWSVAIPSSVTTIDVYAFYECTGLTSVVIPDGVTVIGKYAFAYCSSLGLNSVDFEGAFSLISFGSGPAIVFSNTPWLNDLNANDDWANATVISGASGVLRSCNWKATLESGEPLDSASYDKTLWWSWTAPSGVTMAEFDTFGSGFDTVLGVYTGTSLSSLVEVDVNDNAPGSTASLVKTAVTPGTTYYICVAGKSSSDWGNVKLNWKAWQPSDGFSLIVSNNELLGFFGECPAVVTIPYGVTAIGQSAFDEDDNPTVVNMTSVKIPDSVIEIKKWAFYECIHLGHVEIPASVERIYDEAFRRASGLVNVSFEGPLSAITMDINSAFMQTYWLTHINGNDYWADALAISGATGYRQGFCNALATAETGEPLYSYEKTLWWKWTAPAGVSKAAFYTYGSDFDTYLGIYTGESVSSLSEVAANDQYSYAGDRSSLAFFDVTPGTTYYVCVAGDGSFEFGQISLGWCASDGFSPIVVGDTMIGFLGDCPETVTIPAEVTHIGDSAFDKYVYSSRISGLKHVVIHPGVTTIGYDAFYECVNLETVTFKPDSEMEAIFERAFYGCTSLAAIAIPAGVDCIQSDTFQDCTSLKTVTIPSGVTEIGDDAFYQCYDLETVTFEPDSELRTIGGSAFGYCTSLKQITIPESVAEIEDYAFNASGLEDVEFEGPLREISMDTTYAFLATPWLMHINDNDDWLSRTVILGASGSLKACNMRATYEATEPLYVGDSDLDTTLWWSWTAPAGVNKAMFHTYGSDFDTVLGIYTGDSLSSLSEVAYSDDRSATWSSCSFTVTPGTTYYICVSGYDSYGIIRLGWATSSEDFAFVVDGTGTLVGFMGDCPASVTIPDNVKMIGEGVFAYDSFEYPSLANLKSVTIPGSVIEIDDSAFMDCENLETVELNNGLISLGSEVFRGCKSLKHVLLPTTVKEVYGYTFADMDGAVTVSAPRSLVAYPFLTSGNYGSFKPTDLTVRYYVDVTLDPNEGMLDDGFRSRRIFGDFFGDLSPAPTRAGYSFDGWMLDGSVVLPSTPLPAVATVTLTAQWTKDPDPVPPGPVPPYPVTPDPGTATPDPGTATPDPGTATPDSGTVKVDPESLDPFYPGVLPCYDVLNPADIWDPIKASKAVTLMGAAYYGCDVAGIVELKVGKLNKNLQAKVSGSVTLLNGTKYTIKSKKCSFGDTLASSISLDVKGGGRLMLAIGSIKGENVFSGELGKWHVQTAKVGAGWSKSTATVNVDASATIDTLPSGILDVFLPTNEVATATSGKWTFNKAAKMKWAKVKDGDVPIIQDPASGKGLMVDTSKGKTNLSGLKLTYTPKKGTFKGSFKMYELKGSGAATKLNKYTVNVSGVVVDGVGYGEATCKKPALSWPVTIE